MKEFWLENEVEETSEARESLACLRSQRKTLEEEQHEPGEKEGENESERNMEVTVMIYSLCQVRWKDI